jgi:hypothetical protein
MYRISSLTEESLDAEKYSQTPSKKIIIPAALPDYKLAEIQCKIKGELKTYK